MRERLAAAEGIGERLTTIAFAGGIAIVIFAFLTITATAVAAFRPGDTNPEITQAFNDFGLLAGAAGAAATAAFFGPAAIIGYRYRPYSAPIAGFCALAAVTAPLTIPIVTTDSGVFAPDGVLGLYIPVADLRDRHGRARNRDLPAPAASAGRPAHGPTGAEPAAARVGGGRTFCVERYGGAAVIERSLHAMGTELRVFIGARARGRHPRPVDRRDLGRGAAARLRPTPVEVSTRQRALEAEQRPAGGGPGLIAAVRGRPRRDLGGGADGWADRPDARARAEGGRICHLTRRLGLGTA